MEPAARVEQLIAPSIEAMGFDLVRVKMTGGARARLQIMAERPDGTMSVSDCATVSRAVSAILDVEDPVAGGYDLEVSSPGIDRPLVRLRDFVRFSGFEVRIETLDPIAQAGGRKRFRGKICGVEGETIHLEMEGEAYFLPFETIGNARLVLTDELVQASMKGQLGSRT